MKYRFRRLTSIAMVLVLILSSLSSAAFAASGQQAENFSFLPQEPNVREIYSERLSELEGEEAVYFGTRSADFVEGEGYYSIPVYREGSLETEASVSLMALDVSALYGKDYEFTSEEVYSVGAEETLLQKSVASGTLMTEEEALEQACQTRQLYEEYLKEEGFEEEEGASGEKSFAEEAMSLLGIDAEDDTEALNQMLKAENMDYSAGMVLHFAKGESEKKVVFHLMEDELEEGQEMFMLILTDAEGTVIKEQYTFSAVIDDNEELHDALISFSAAEYASALGQVKVTVNRTVSEYSLINFYVKSVRDTAEPGVNYTEFHELLVMQPWQTSVDYSFDVTGSGRMEVVLEPVTGCQLRECGTAAVRIDVQESEEELAALREAEKQVDALAEKAGAENASWQETELLGKEADQQSFTISINGKDYLVDMESYTKTEAPSILRADIIDPKYKEVKPKVGDYYFATYEQFDFNNVVGNPTDGYARYVSNEQAKDSYAELKWYDWRVSRRGESWIRSKTGTQSHYSDGIPLVYYRTILPD